MSKLMQQFEAVLPYLTMKTTESYFESPLSECSEPVRAEKDPVKHVVLSKERMCLYSECTTLMASCASSDFLIYAFCHVEGELSIIKLHLFGKSNQKEGSQTLQTIHMKATSLKMLLTEEGLQLMVGTKCGQLLIYSQLESGTAELRCSKISACPLVDMITPSLNKSLFILAQNGVVYLFDVQQGQVRYQFQGESPMMENKKALMMLNASENCIGCSFSYGKVILWQVASDLKAQFAKIQSGLDSGSETDLQETKVGPKKRGKDRLLRKVMIKPRVTFTGICSQGVKWINFVGDFIALLTEQDILKIYGVNLEQKASQCELFCLLSSTVFLLRQNQAKQQGYCCQKVESVVSFSRGILVCVNRWEVANRKKFIFSRLQKYVFGENFSVEPQMSVTLPYTWPIEDISWCQESEFVMCRGQDQYSLLLAPELKDS